MENVQITCHCGCGTRLDKHDKYGRERKFVSGHNNRKFTGSESGRSASTRRWRHNNPDKVRDAKKIQYRRAKIKAINYLGCECVFCGVVYDGKNAPIFEFHHFDPSTKDAGISTMLPNKAWASVQAELDKCHLVCANCHNQHHGGEW